VDRRHFIKFCTSAAAAVAAQPEALLAAGEAIFKRYASTLLVDGDGGAFKASALKEGTNYLFHYPYAGTPALLMRLAEAPATNVPLRTATLKDYRWQGGVGPGGRIVAFSAICPHQLSAVFKTKTFISYRPKKSQVAGRANTIVCCAHHSVFDPLQGGKAVSGPTPQPLTAIVLEYDKKDRLFAVGTAGGELFEGFFKAYRRELIDEFGRGVARQETTKTSVVHRLEDYTGSVIRC
jgi:arsenite oxidase small subunit